MLSSIRKYRGRLIVAAVVVAIPVLALAWWLGSPLFINKTVDEEFPYSVGVVVPEGMTRAQVDRTMETMAMMEEEVSEAMPEAPPLAADEMMVAVMDGMTPEMMAQAIESMTPEMRAEVAETMAEAVPGMTPEMVAEAMESMTPEMMTGVMQNMSPEMMAQMAVMMPEMMAPAGPVAVKQGTFRDADSFHKGEGSATLYTLPDGSHVLRFEDFRVTNGPDLRVLLASHPDPMSRGNVHSGEYVELAKLKGNIGNQNYEIPADIDLGNQNSVIIYCMPFHVIFSVAPLERAG
jgi:hypothetical protein